MTTAAIDTAQVPKTLLTGAYAYGRRTTMQSFAIDSTAQEIYTLQCVPDKVSLVGDPKSPMTFDDRAANGDLLCTRMDLQGRILDWMYLRGFGHGTSLGVVPRTGGGVDLWLEGDPVRRGDYTEGRAVATTPYVPWNSAANTAVTYKDPTVRSWTPAGAPNHCIPAVDVLGRRIVVGTRAALPAAPYTYVYQLYDLDAAARGEWTPVPDTKAITRTQPYPQGLATFGDHLYLWNGHGDLDDAVVTTLDWRTGGPIRSTPIRREPTDHTREPEGIAAWTGTGDGADRTRLVIGFAVSELLDGKRTDRAITLKYFPGPAEPDLTVQVLVDWTPIALADGVTSDFTSRPPQARLISVAGSRLLQLSGKIACRFADETRPGGIGTLPPALAPSAALQAGCPRNARDGFAVCQVEVDDQGTVSAYGATAANTIDWIQLDNVSLPWA